jgi:hypothetical protein
MAAREILVEISRRAANQYLAQSKTARTEALAYVADLRRQEKALLKLAIDAHRESRKFWLT